MNEIADVQSSSTSSALIGSLQAAGRGIRQSKYLNTLFNS